MSTGEMRGELKATFQRMRIIGFALLASLGVYTFIVHYLKNAPAPEAPPDMVLFRYLFIGLSIGIFFLIRFLRHILLARASNVLSLQSATVVSLALCESVVLFGFVLYFLGREINDFYIFLGLSLFYFIVYFPRAQQWQEWGAKIGLQ